MVFAAGVVFSGVALGGTYWVGVDRAGDLQSGHGVQWRGQVVGEVIEIRPQDSKVQIHFRLDDAFLGLMHENTQFQVNNGLVSGRPTLDLYGPLKATVASSVPPAKDVAVKAPSNPLALPPSLPGIKLLFTVIGTSLALGLAFTIGKKLVKLVAIGLIILVFVAAAGFFFVHWKQNQGQYMTSSIEAAVTDLGMRVFRTESERTYWRGLQEEILNSLDRLSSVDGVPSSDEIKRLWEKQVDQRIADLMGKDENSDIVDALKRFKQEVTVLMDRLAQHRDKDKQ